MDAQIGANPTDAAARIRQLEDAGFGGAWMGETNHNPFVGLAIAAASSRRIVLGTNIAAAFVRSPMDTAYLGWDMQATSEGRFILGLGSLIKPHVTRRFSMPWTRPVDRMKEYVEALGAIWDVWESGGKLDFRGDFYQHTLMSPMFVPPPNTHGRPKVYLAAVGPRMTRMAGQVADGLLCHALATPQFLRDVALPAVREGQEVAGRPSGDVEIAAAALVVAAESPESYATQLRGARRTIALSCTVPAYRIMLEHHGWGDAHDELRALSRQRRWSEMPDVIDDVMLHTIAAVGTPAQVGEILATRYGGLVDRLAVVTPFDVASGDPRAAPTNLRPLVESLRDAIG
ncbi:MAG: TIGR03617 family F420-dependent LLM class oxidoreductase [bacterium]|nr:TIGR03617 family F420-dependent LLM class oxidoreductase [bacterium]